VKPWGKRQNLDAAISLSLEVVDDVLTRQAIINQYVDKDF
jgi:hypothetical protein